jgi:hypothetical protein
MRRGSQNQNTKRNPAECFGAISGFLNKVFELRRDQSRLRTKESGQRKPEEDVNPTAPAKSSAQLLFSNRVTRIVVLAGASKHLFWNLANCKSVD